MKNNKKCKQCGSDIAEGTMFCSKCGTKVSEEDETVTKKKGPKKKVIMGVCISTFLVMVLALVVVFIIVPYFQPQNRTMRAIKASDYDRAVEIYKDDVRGEDGYRDFVDLYREYLEECKDNYYTEKLAYEDLCIVLTHVSDFNIKKLNELAIEIQSYADTIHQSRTNWSVAEELFANKSYPEAMEYYNQVDATDSYFEAAKGKYNECIELYRSLMLERAEAYAEKQEYFSALNIINDALMVLEGDTQLVTKQALYTTQAAEKSVFDAIAEATALYDSGSYAEAMDVLELIMESHSDAELTNLYNKCVAAFEEQEIKDACAEAEELYQQQLYEKAISVLDEAMKTYESSELTELHTKCIAARNQQVIKEAEVKAGEHYNIKEYKQVFATLDSYLSTYASQSEVVGALTEVRDEYAETVRMEYLNKAKEEFAASGYKAAVDVISEGLSILANDSELTDAYNGYMEYKPVSLLDLEYFNAAQDFEITNVGQKEDNLGVEHDNVLMFSGDDREKEVWVEYLVNRDFSTLSGTFFLSYSWRTTTSPVSVKIYGDGELLYQATVTGGVKPIDFMVDISKVEKLKIVYTSFLYLPDGVLIGIATSAKAGYFANMCVAK